MQIISKVTKALFLMLFLVAGLGVAAHADQKIWRQPSNPLNYVTLEKLNKQEKAENPTVRHPYTFNAEQLTNMLLSLRYNKSLMFRDDIEDAQIFFDENLLRKKFVPRMIEAFQKAGPDQAVIVSIVQKKPFFIIRNDRLNVFRAFVANDGLHIRFIKTDAKLTGDYQARVTGTKIADRVKGLRVSLEPQKGQKLGLNDPREIILALEHDFANQVAAQSDQEEPKKGGKKTKTTPTTDSSKSSTERLKELKSLKDQGLITPQEYEEKKKEILSGI